jgi:hypothetical protein
MMGRLAVSEPEAAVRVGQPGSSQGVTGGGTPVRFDKRRTRQEGVEMALIPRGPKAETASQLIQQYVDWIISQPQTQGVPARVAFILTQNNPASFGTQPATSQPELIYSYGMLAYSGGNTLSGYGTLQSNQNNFGGTDMVYINLETNGVLTLNGGSSWPLTLHHDVLVGSTFMPVESTSPGSVVTLMLWEIPWSPVR